MGKCPVYEMHVDNEQKAGLKIIRFMQLDEGYYSTIIADSIMKNLKSIVDSMSWKSYKNEYVSGYSDFPSTVIWFSQEAGDTTRIKFEKNTAPEKLENIAKELDQLATNTAIWNREETN